jgi:hypothetical protein
VSSWPPFPREIEADPCVEALRRPARGGCGPALARMDLMTVKELMGHKTIAMTQRYAHLSPAHKLNAVERISRRTTGTTTDTSSETAKERREPATQVHDQRKEKERATGVEPATSSLGSWHSTTELRPRRLELVPQRVGAGKMARVV